jgi:cell division FtsZ-interacting protein ZapD
VNGDGLHDAARRRTPPGNSMSSLKKTLMQKGMKLMSDPRVMKMMQDERVMKAVMAAMSVPGKAQSLAKEQLENVAKAMALATESEVKDLRRTVRRLEEELTKMKHADGGEKSPKKKSSAAE